LNPPFPLRMSRSWSWLLPAVPLLCIVLLALLGWTVWSGEQGRRAQADAATFHMAASAAGLVARELEQFDRRLLNIIYRHQSLALQDIDPQARNAANFEALQREPYFVFADVLDTSGRSSAGLPRNSNNWFDRDYFAPLEHGSRSDMFVGDHFFRKDEDNIGITVSRRMTDGEDRFAGVVVLGIRLAHFRQLLGQFEGVPGQSVMLLRRDGTIIMRLPFRLNDAGDRLEPGTPLDIALRTGAASAVAPDPIDRVQRRFALHAVGTYPLAIVVGASTASPSLDPAFWWLVTAVCAVGLATLLLAAQQWPGWHRQLRRRPGRGQHAPASSSDTVQRRRSRRSRFPPASE
jgi:hypothetical protein